MHVLCLTKERWEHEESQCLTKRSARRHPNTSQQGTYAKDAKACVYVDELKGSSQPHDDKTRMIKSTCHMPSSLPLKDCVQEGDLETLNPHGYLLVWEGYVLVGTSLPQLS
jgi:hypothetical protein